MKQVWGLGAAVLSLLLIVLFWTVYVTGRLATTERLAPSETAEGIEVPVIGTVGDFPEPEHRLVVNVTAEGRIILDGEQIPFDALVERMQKLRAERDAARGTGAAREVSVVIHADRRVPCGAAFAVSAQCPPPIWFSVRHESDGDEGAIVVWPEPWVSEGPPEDDHGERFVVRRIHVSAKPGDCTPPLLYDDARREVEPPTRLVARLDADRSLPVGDALAYFDALLRAGAADVELSADNPAHEHDREFFRRSLEAPVTGGMTHMTVVADGEELKYVRVNGSVPVNVGREESHEVTARPGSQPMPPRARVRGGPAGLLAPPRVGLID